MWEGEHSPSPSHFPFSDFYRLGPQGYLTPGSTQVHVTIFELAPQIGKSLYVAMASIYVHNLLFFSLF